MSLWPYCKLAAACRTTFLHLTVAAWQQQSVRPADLSTLTRPSKPSFIAVSLMTQTLMCLAQGLASAFPCSKQQANSTLLTVAAELKSILHEAQNVLASLEELQGGGSSLSMPISVRHISTYQVSLSATQLTELRASWPKEQRELMQEADGMLLTVMLIKEDCALQAHDNQQRLINRAQCYQKQLSELSSKLRFA